MFNHTRLRAELFNIHQSLAHVAAGQGGRSIVTHLREVTRLDVPPPSLIWQALHGDCLRIAYTAIAADGDVTDAEVAELAEYLYMVSRHYATLVSGYRELTADDGETARTFLEHFASDHGTFGYLCPPATRWLGLDLCQRAAQLGETTALERYERMAAWFMEAVLAVGGATHADPRWAARLGQIEELRQALAKRSQPRAPAGDLRGQVFLSGRRAFSAVALAATVFDDDPFDVEAVHARPREVFRRLVEQAGRPAAQAANGRMLLLLGDAGAGKTHLLRAFRREVHDGGLGFVAYAQLQSRSHDYARYLLNHVIDSLDRPFGGSPGGRSGLYELASGLPRLAGEPLRSRIARLADDWPDTLTLTQYVNGLVDDLLRCPELTVFDPDFLRVLLYALRQDPRIATRVSRYLRCEDMNAHDRGWIGDVIPRTGPDDPLRMIRWICRLAFATQGAVMVVMVDQAELATFSHENSHAFGRAVSALYEIVDHVPSAVVVVACLEDLWTQVSKDLTKACRDRLEIDPPIERLTSTRTYPEIEAIVAKRLAWLYAEGGAEHRVDEPVYPIPADRLREIRKSRARDVLDLCQRFQDHCARLGRIDDAWPGWRSDEEPQHVDTRAVDQIAAEWNDHLNTGTHDVRNEDDALLGLVATAAEACAREYEGIRVASSTVDGVLMLDFSHGPVTVALALGIANRSYHRNAFGTQVEHIRKVAGGKRTAVVMRTSEFPGGKVSTEKLAALVREGGRKHQLTVADLRTAVAMSTFAPRCAPDDLARWRRRDRPLLGPTGFAALFDLDVLAAVVDGEKPGPDRGGTADGGGSGAGSAGTRAGGASPAAGSAASANANVGGARAASGAVPVSGVTAESSAAAGGGIPASGGRTTSPVATGPLPGVPTSGGAPAASGGAPTSGGAPAHGAAHPGGTTPGATQPESANAASGSSVRAGTTIGFRPQPLELPHATLLRHVGVLGSTGSGKTTLALHLLEQLLEHGVPVLLIDRKGDLAGYARPGWWQAIRDPDRRQRAETLAARLDVRLFTPGTRGGRPLAFCVVPGIEGVPEHERGRLIQHAASALAAMMRLGEGSQDAARRAILGQAITVLAERGGFASLEEVLALLESRDDDLLARAGRYEDRLFGRLITDLETLRLSSSELFDRSAEPLSAETLLGPADHRVPLSIISTRFLGDHANIQAWIAQLLVELSRWCMRDPRNHLRAVVMLDEADLYMPAIGKPPSKEPLQDLLKRARAAGLGVMLATQSPGDLDYRSREQINTWLVGRVTERRSIEKLEPLFERKPSAAAKLGDLRPGQFVVVQDATIAEIERTPSLLITEPVPEAEILQLAASHRPMR